MVKIVFDDPPNRSAVPRSVFTIDNVLFNILPTSMSSGTTRPLTGGIHALDLSTLTWVIPIGAVIRELKVHIARQANPIDIVVTDATGRTVASHTVVPAEEHVSLSPATGAAIRFIAPNNEAFLYSIEIT
jgi:hypothetical protein